MQNKPLCSLSRSKIQKIINFWYPWPDFDRHSKMPASLRHMQSLWYGGGDQLDNQMRNEFKDDLDNITQNDFWLHDKDGLLAFILITDQFSRNIYRGTKNAFGTDYLALNAAK